MQIMQIIIEVNLRATLPRYDRPYTVWRVGDKGVKPDTARSMATSWVSESEALRAVKRLFPRFPKPPRFQRARISKGRKKRKGPEKELID